MKKFYILMIAMLIPSFAFAQMANDALLALKKLKARIQVGISYNDYGPVLGEAQFQINLFLESPSAKENYKFAEAVKNAMKHYNGALEVWGCRFGESLKEVLPSPEYDNVIEII